MRLEHGERADAAQYGRAVDEREAFLGLELQWAEPERAQRREAICRAVLLDFIARIQADQCAGDLRERNQISARADRAQVFDDWRHAFVQERHEARNELATHA